jgi:hypothetical protein
MILTVKILRAYKTYDYTRMEFFLFIIEYGKITDSYLMWQKPAWQNIISDIRNKS